MKQSKGNDQAWEQFLKSCGIQGPLRDGLRQYYGVWYRYGIVLVHVELVCENECEDVFNARIRER